MNKEVKNYLRVQRKLVVLEYAKVSGSNLEAYKASGIPRSTFYHWKKAYNNEIEEGLKWKKLLAKSHPRSLSQEAVDKILELRRVYQLGSKRITWYLERYHGIQTSESSVTRTLVRHKENRLPKNTSRRTVHTKRYFKKVPGHHIQVDVKFISL